MPAPDTDELNEFIDDILSSKLQVLRNARAKRGIRRRTILAIMGFLFIPATAIVTWAVGVDGWTGQFDPAALLWVPAMMIAIFAALYFPLRWAFTGAKLPFEYKPDMVVPLIHFIDPRLKSQPRKSPKDLVEACPIFDEPVDDLRYQDYFGGELRDMELHLSILEFGDRQGFFAAAKLPRQISGTHLAFAHLEPSSVGQDLPLDLQEQDRQERCRELRFRSTDAEAARELLDAPILKRICGLFDAFQTGETTPVALSLSGDQFSLFAEKPKHLDRPKGLTSITDTSHLHELGDQLSRIVDLAEALRDRFPSVVR